MARVLLHGGPADGGSIPANTAYYRWVHPDRPDRSYADPGDGRRLYRRRGDGDYEFVDHHEEQCSGCGGFRIRDDNDCPLCGTPSASSHRGVPERER